jgi:hypothetical protein
MKRTIIISAVFLTLNAIGQVKSENSVSSKAAVNKDATIKVIYQKENAVEKKPACFLNGKYIDESVLYTLKPEGIEDVKIEKENTEIEGVKYFGKIIIRTKDSYKPNLLSLNQMKVKYTDCKEGSTIFQIDDKIVKTDYDKYLVDETFILKIIVDKLENPNEKLDVNIIKLYTKLEENIKKENEIRIHGTEEMTINK